MGGLLKRAALLRIVQDSRCPYCTVALPNGSWCGGITIDHIHPRSRGGGNTPDNLVAAHPPCNNRKSDRLPFPCEILFGQVTGEIFLARHPRYPSMPAPERPARPATRPESGLDWEALIRDLDAVQA